MFMYCARQEFITVEAKPVIYTTLLFNRNKKIKSQNWNTFCNCSLEQNIIVVRNYELHNFDARKNYLAGQYHQNTFWKYI